MTAFRKQWSHSSSHFLKFNSIYFHKHHKEVFLSSGLFGNLNNWIIWDLWKNDPKKLHGFWLHSNTVTLNLPMKTTTYAWNRPIANTSTSKASQGGNFKGELSSGRVVEGVLLFGWFGESLGAKAPDLAATKPIHSELWDRVWVLIPPCSLWMEKQFLAEGEVLSLNLFISVGKEICQCWWSCQRRERIRERRRRIKALP